MPQKTRKLPPKAKFFEENGGSKQKKGYFCSEFTRSRANNKQKNNKSFIIKPKTK